MRELSTYTAREWMQAQPLVHAIKLVRNTAAERFYRRRPSPALEQFLHDHAGLRDRTIAVAVAFNTPWTVKLLLRTTGENFVDTSLIVVDNSSSGEAREEIRALCAEAGVPYLPLPRNLIHQASRSHGAALTWTYHNLIKPLRPAVFAFVDHDLFPLSPIDLASRVADQPVFGRKNPPGFGWSIWAGYCVYDFAEASQHELDFGTDRARGHDTGGRNWVQFYRYLDKDRVRLADLCVIELHDPLTGASFPIEMMDVFAHYGYASHPRIIRPERREFFARFLDDAALKKQALELARAPAARVVWPVRLKKAR